MTAREAMTPAPLTVTPRTSVGATLRLARDNGISRVPVLEQGAPEALVTEDERLVGILTHSDLLRALIRKEPEAAA